MSVELYISNLALDITEEDVAALVGEHATVKQVRRIIIQQTNQPKESMLVEIEEDDAARHIINTLNGYRAGERRVYVSPARPDKLKFNAPEEKAYTEDLINRLGETADDPKRQLQNLVQYCGPAFAEILYEETLEVEARDGLLVRDGSRRRTTGGVFFHLARLYLANKMQKAIFYIKPVDKDNPRPRKEKPAGKPAGDRPQGQPRGEKPGGKPRPDRDRGDKRGGYAAPPPVPVVEIPLPVEQPKEVTPEVVEQYQNLKAALQDAKHRLSEIQAQPKNKQAGLFSATKEVFQFESQLKSMLKDYPDLA